MWYLPTRATGIVLKVDHFVDYVYIFIVTKEDAHRIDAVDQWCLRTLLGIKWH